DRVVERAERPSVVSGGLAADAQPALARVTNGGRHVVLVLGEHDRHGALVDQQVEGGTGVVPAVRPWNDDAVRGDAGEKRRRIQLWCGGGHDAQRLPPRTPAHRGRHESPTPRFRAFWGPPN